MCAWMYGYCFLFFKQKTAYDVRISDWSSRGSSDLPLQFRCIFIRLCRRLRIRALASGAFACAGGLFWLIKFDVLAIEREIHTVAYIGEPLGWRRQAE